MQSTKASFATCTLVLVAALSAAGSASATKYRDTSAAGACHAANGGASASFSFSNNYVTNVGATSQFVICHFAMYDVEFIPPTSTVFIVHAQSTQAGDRLVSCSAQTGSFYAGANHVISNQVRANTFTAPGYTGLSWTASTFTRNNPWETLTLNCRMDPGTRIGLIEWRTN